MLAFRRPWKRYRPHNSSLLRQAKLALKVTYMAQFSFYAVAEDVEAIFCALSDQDDLKFIPDRSYPTADFIVLKEVRTEAERSLSQNRCWFIMGSFTKKAPCVRKTKSGVFYISLEYEGPILSLTMPPLGRIQNGIRELVPGSLRHPRAYWDHAITASHGVPDEVRVAYAKIVKIIKGYLIRRKLNQNLWMGKNAARLIDEGLAVVLSNGKWRDGKGEDVDKPF